MKKIILLLILIILISGCARPEPPARELPGQPRPSEGTKECAEEGEFCGGIAGIMCCGGSCKYDGNYPDAGGICTSGLIKETEPEVEVLPWKAGSVAIAGKYADAEIIKTKDGKYRIYYAAEPEVPNFEGQVYSAISSDGIKWSQESGVRMKWATFPSIITLTDNTYRMYYQNAGLIKSATSSDGISWSEESGTRIDTVNTEGLTLENVAAPTVIKTGTEYVMVYRGTINEKYPEKVPNPDTQLFLWATSKDGLTFEKKGMALDSRNDEFKGLLDGPELVKWDDETIRLYFWSYKGVYHVTFNGKTFSQEEEFDFTTSSDPMVPFPEDPPSDPTLAKINNKWFMYYGQHTQGIYYAVLE